tara:strand:+ start:7711 stop:8835 length:1125 start_codon:yes stop_codon:yes gene_type:complete
MSFLIIGGFLFGVFVGHYETFPFEILSKLKNLNTEEIPSRLQIYQDINTVESLISINSVNDIGKIQTALKNYIWINGDFPSNKLPAKYEMNISDPISMQLKNLERIDSFTVEMEYGMNSVSYLFQPNDSNQKLVIFHQGHHAISLRGFDDHSFDQDIPLIQHLLDNGYSVLIFSMPGKGMNNEPIIEIEKFGKIRLNSHDHFRFIESENLHPIKFFIEPIIVTLNQIDRNYSFISYDMIGISGGGWTTVVVSSIEPRIGNSYSVAGTFPIWLRMDVGDYEQHIPEFYRIANYEELYILSSFGNNKTLMLIYNEFDSCCFRGDIYNQFSFESIIQEKLSKFGYEEDFTVIIDYGQKEHIISDYSLEKITEHMKQN